MDPKGNNHKAAGRPDGGRFDRKAGQGFAIMGRNGTDSMLDRYVDQEGGMDSPQVAGILVSSDGRGLPEGTPAFPLA